MDKDFVPSILLHTERWLTSTGATRKLPTGARVKEPAYWMAGEQQSRAGSCINGANGAAEHAGEASSRWLKCGA